MKKFLIIASICTAALIVKDFVKAIKARKALDEKRRRFEEEACDCANHCSDSDESGCKDEEAGKTSDKKLHVFFIRKAQ